jgi:hypothetical protein
MERGAGGEETEDEKTKSLKDEETDGDLRPDS